MRIAPDEAREVMGALKATLRTSMFPGVTGSSRLQWLSGSDDLGFPRTTLAAVGTEVGAGSLAKG